MRIEWFYLNTGTKKHAVEPAELKMAPVQKAVCGRQVFTYLPPIAQWLNDAAGLAEREECKQCMEKLEG